MVGVSYKVCQNKIHQLLSDSRNESYADKIQKQYEEFVYLDKAGFSSADDKLTVHPEQSEKLFQLEEDWKNKLMV